MKQSGVTMRDVAKLAGVSHQTVSRVINGDPSVLPETRQRVDQAVGELGYRPNAIARSLAEGRTHMLACFAPNLTDYTFANIIEGAEAEARQCGYFLVASSVPDETNFSNLIDQLVSSRRTEGLLVINPYIDSRHQYINHLFPTVLIGSVSREDGIGSVCLNDEEAGYQATRYLLDLGHCSIACITGPTSEDCVHDRTSGYQRALGEAGKVVDPSLIGYGDWSAATAYRVVEQWLQKPLRFSAIFAQNDSMAIGAIRALRSHKIRVPEDVSVIGVDDMPLASYFDPPLTTIRQDTYAIGREAARLLIQTIENPDLPNSYQRLPVELVVRQSTQPCK